MATESTCEVPADHSVHVVQLATQVRALGHAGKRIVMFASVGDAPRSEDLIQKIANLLSLLDRAVVSVIRLKDGSHSRTAPLSLWESSVATADSSKQMPEQTGLRAPKMKTPGETAKLLLHSYSAEESPNNLTSLLADVQPKSGYVLIDAPDLTTNASTSLATPYAQAVVLMVQRDGVRREQIITTRKQFRDLGATVAGFVFLD